MMPYSAYQLYQAERVKSEAERRRADLELGMMAADVSRLWGQMTRLVRPLRRQHAPYSRTARYTEPGLAACEAKIA
jgi:hypothetical protein